MTSLWSQEAHVTDKNESPSQPHVKMPTPLPRTKVRPRLISRRQRVRYEQVFLLRNAALLFMCDIPR